MLRIGYFTTVPAIGRSAEDDFGRAVVEVLLAERLGFASAWVGETPFSRRARCPNGLTFASHLAGVTSTIRIGCAVVLLPLHPPWLVSQQAALVDVLSGGRFDLGIGRGFDPGAYAAAGVAFEERDALLEAGVDVVQRALATGEVDTGDGGSPLEPMPVQRPMPLWVAVTSGRRSVELAARRRLGLLLGGPSPVIARNLAAYRAACEADALAGSGPACVARPVVVDEDDDRARRLGRQSIQIELDKRPVANPLTDAAREELLDDLVIAGSPQRVADRLGALRAHTGVELLVAEVSFGCVPAGVAAETLSHLARIGADVG